MSQEQGVHRRGVKSANCIHPRVENCIQAKFYGDVLKDWLVELDVVADKRPPSQLVDLSLDGSRKHCLTRRPVSLRELGVHQDQEIRRLAVDGRRTSGRAKARRRSIFTIYRSLKIGQHIARS